MNVYPLRFEPILKERIWGGRNLESLYNKSLPPNVPVGESWEVSDRKEDSSVITNGEYAGNDLTWLMKNFSSEIMGQVTLHSNRFPLLVKILDAQQKLSLQVHPPAEKATQMGGEPKTEMWFVTHAEPGADLFVGLKNGVTEDTFRHKIDDGSVADCFHQIKVSAGDAMFLPSGRVHAIGAGNVIFEIQQNSDTTFRVFDWNRTGLDGKPRELHIDSSMKSIDFLDFEPPLCSSLEGNPVIPGSNLIVDDALFSVETNSLAIGETASISSIGKPIIIGVYKGALSVNTPSSPGENLLAGQFCLIPACAPSWQLSSIEASDFLIAVPR